jgi:hypothetical protein
MAEGLAPRLTLSETDCVTLSSWTRRRRTAHALALRARIARHAIRLVMGNDGTHRSTQALEDSIRQQVNLNHEDSKPFVWIKTADDMLASIEQYCLRTSQSGHQLELRLGQRLT